MPAVAGLQVTDACGHSCVNELYTFRIYDLTVMLIKVGADVSHDMMTTNT
jgi:hypothetical protein